MNHDHTPIDAQISPKQPGDLTRPASGWTDRRLGIVFGDASAQDVISRGAIAGIVVGSVVALALLATGSWYLWKWLRADPQAAHTGDHGQATVWQAPDRGES